MATVTLSVDEQGRQSRGRGVYIIEGTLDFAAAATAKGGALAAADVIQVLDVPANTVVLTAGMEVTTAFAGENADTRLDLGVTGVNPDAWVDGADLTSSTAGDYAQAPAAHQAIVIGSAADTIDVLIQASTTPPTSGALRVWALCMDVDAHTGPSEVDRDTLA